MIGRVLLAAILAGIAAGLVTGVIQHVRVTPLILAAEQYEGMQAAPHDHADAPAAGDTASVAPDSGAAAPAAAGHDHSKMTGDAAASAGHEHDANAWMPQEGFERTFYSILTRTLSAVGFALMLAGLSYLANIPITRGNGLIWGVCGFIAVSLAPAIGLPPVLPGVPEADITMRQLWWGGTILCTGLAIWLVVSQSQWQRYLIAAAFAIAPHVFGAPHIPPGNSPLPAALASEFATISLGLSLVMWLLIGLFLAFTLNPSKENAA